MLRAGAAIQGQSVALAQAASQATGSGGGGGVHPLQSPAHTTLLGYTYMIRGCSIICNAASLGGAAAEQLCRAAVPLLTGAGRTFLDGSAGGSSSGSGSGPGAVAL